MAPIRVDGTHFSADTRSFIQILHRHAVRYLIVGGEAVIFHGHARLTGDVDFLLATGSENGERLFHALSEFWSGDVPGIDRPEDLAEEGLILQFGYPPNRIDIISSIEGVSFEDAWRSRVDAILVTREGEFPIPYIGLDQLIENKRAVGRPKDLDDLAYLEEARRKGE